jgi:hypothetical protein
VKPCVISSNSFASGYLSPQALLTTSVGGCCYSREIPVAKQKENRRRKIHAVRTHPKNEVKTATAKNSHHSNEKSAAIQLQHVVWWIPSQKHTFF